MAQTAVSHYSYEAYLALEAEADTKHEYHDGFIVAMAGGTPVHSQIGANATTALNVVLQKEAKPCITFNSDLKIHIEAVNRTFYPDASVACESPVYSDKDPNALTNPILIIEVLSDSTAAFDRGLKFSHYRQLPSLQEYVLISQEEAMVDTYYRVEENLWEIRTITGFSASVELKSIGITVQMSDIYRLVPGIAT